MSIKNVDIVLGLNFGDEGKGRVVSRLCRSKKETLVVRFSGGPQAGHTVVHKDMRHIFSSFGSGTLKGIPTYWSRFCPVDPTSLIKEYMVLKDLGLHPKITIDPLSPLITPFDILHQRNHDKTLENGTCAVGVGSTIERQENMYKLYFMDIFNDKILRAKLQNIKTYYRVFDNQKYLYEKIV